jgi:hypothetical protein
MIDQSFLVTVPMTPNKFKKSAQLETTAFFSSLSMSQNKKLMTRYPKCPLWRNISSQGLLLEETKNRFLLLLIWASVGCILDNIPHISQLKKIIF